MTRRACLLVVLALAVSSASAQNAPAPPTPFPAVIESHVGRVLDSSDNPNDGLYSDVSTRARAVLVAPEIDRLYVFINFGTLAAYRLSTLETRINTEARATTAFGEAILTPEHIFGGTVPFWGAIDDIDYDDRGYTYIAQRGHQLRILDPTFNSVAVVGDPLLDPTHVAVVRSGGTYYAVVSRGDYGVDPISTSIYDVSNPAAPVLLRKINDILLSGEDSAAGHLVYYGHANGVYTLFVSTVERLLNGQPPLFSAPAPARPSGYPFRSWFTDATNFFAEVDGGTVIPVLQPQGGTYVLSQSPFPGPAIPVAAPAREYFAIGPYLYRGAEQRYELVEDAYFANYGPRMRQAAGGRELRADVMGSMAPVTVGGRPLLIVPANSLLEVFTLAPPQELSHQEDVPTASEWALLALAGVLAAIAVLRLNVR